jgi:proteic killer suppression protein
MEYLDDALRRLATEPGHRQVGWSAHAVRAFREAIQCVDAAKSDVDLRALRSLRMRPRPDLKPGAWVIDLDDVLALVLAFKTEGRSATAVLDVLNGNREGRR